MTKRIKHFHRILMNGLTVQNPRLKCVCDTRMTTDEKIFVDYSNDDYYNNYYYTEIIYMCLLQLTYTPVLTRVVAVQFCGFNTYIHEVELETDRHGRKLRDSLRLYQPLCCDLAA